MSIIRVIAVDPRPRKGEGDIMVYQVPDRSRAMELLQELCDLAGIEHAVIETPPKKGVKA